MTALHTRAYVAFATALADARRSAGVSQKQLARRLGVTQSFISKYEAARRRLDVVEFVRIIEALGVDPIQVLGPLIGRAGRFDQPD
jgi:transcriptional regulator with XRE-family HTH domain